MKKIFFLLMIVSLSFVGCKQDNDAEPNYQSEVVLNGTKKVFNKMHYLGGSGVYSISNYDTDANPNSIDITLISPPVGSVNFGLMNRVEINIDGITYFSKEGSGQFLITQIGNSFISGSFTGTFTFNTSEVTISGNFSADILSQTL